jgi:hypothetical protein
MAARQWDDLPGLERGSQYSSEVPQPCNPHRTGSDPIRPSDQRMDLHRTALPPVVIQEVSGGLSLQLAISRTTGAVRRRPALGPRCGLVAAFECQWFQSPLGFAVRLKCRRVRCFICHLCSPCPNAERP